DHDAPLAAVRIVSVDERDRGRPRRPCLVAAPFRARRARRSRRRVRARQPRIDGGLRHRGASAFVPLLLRDGRDAPREIGDDDRARGAPPLWRAPAEAEPAMTRSHLLLALGALLVLGAVNYSIVAKESIKANGEAIYLDLTPIDPRSLVQGDYMA